ncbi:uncharacterized protein EURHEDRAFT_413217 [Aspergillus ruber CBS 135680]|uniref:Uncharacterized protein n=1 Tax=Aspergillus ruber (strain CBS 135680) TaxID=1388766 RepID=A0A017SCQ0_ASPRC|nr:uncharacterized protein EURHEDRAFT_413217 [Aspergillus ruber CBS 135680]EYE94414.1 hypothetical protein EURHEDRAFT_413217 [Aspergillus ruber CBS 135680]
MKEVNDSGELTRLYQRPEVSITPVIRLGILRIAYLGLSSGESRGRGTRYVWYGKKRDLEPDSLNPTIWLFAITIYILVFVTKQE